MSNRGSYAGLTVKKGEHNVGYQQGSFLYMFLKEELKFDESHIKNCTSVDDCLKQLASGSARGGISAYYDVLPHTTAMLSSKKYNTKHLMAGPVYHTYGFALAFPKGFPMVANISTAIIQTMTKNGFIQRQVDETNKDLFPDIQGDSSSIRVRLQGFSLLFVVTSCVTLICLAISIYLHQRASVGRRMLNLRIELNQLVVDFRRVLLADV